MNNEEFTNLKPGQKVFFQGHERQVLSHHGIVVDLTDPPSKGVISVSKNNSSQMRLIKEPSEREKETKKCLQLINEVRGRIGQRKLEPKKSGYSDQDVWQDAVFYIKTQVWARVRARELGLIE